MSLSSLNEIKLDFSWVRALFEDTSREKSIEECLSIEKIPINSWMLVVGDDRLVNYCAKRWPYHKFVTFSDSLMSSNNIHVFHLTLDEFANNTNEEYDNFIVKNRVGYRGVFLSNIPSEPILKRIDKQLYKDYDNEITSKVIVYTSANNQISNFIPYFKEIMCKTDHRLHIQIFHPINDFYPN